MFTPNLIARRIAVRRKYLDARIENVFGCKSIELWSFDCFLSHSLKNFSDPSLGLQLKENREKETVPCHVIENLF